MTIQAPRLTRAVVNLSFINLINLVVGFGLAIVVANYFGTTAQYDAYILAWMIPELLIFVFSNLALATVMPNFLERENQASVAQAWRESWRAMTTILLGGMVLSAFAILLTPTILNWTESEIDRSQIILALIPWMIFTFWLSLLHRLLSGLHYAHRSYLITHASAVFLPLGMILGALWGAQDYGVLALAWGMTAGALAQVILLMPAILKWGGRYFSMTPGGRMLKQIGLMSLPLLFYAIADRATVVIDRSIASSLSAGAISALKYGQQLILAAAALVSVPITRVLLVESSKAAAINDVDGFEKIFARGTAGAGILVMLVVALVVPLSHSIVAVFLERGAFDADSTSMVGSVLALYTLSLPAITAISLLQTTNISFKRPIPLSISGGIALIMTLVLDLILVNIWGYQGIALANVLVQFSWATVLFLLTKSLIRKPVSIALLSLVKSICAATIVGIGIWMLDKIWFVALGTWSWLKLGVLILMGTASYAGILLLVKEKITAELSTKVLKRIESFLRRSVQKQ